MLFPANDNTSRKRSKNEIIGARFPNGTLGLVNNPLVKPFDKNQMFKRNASCTVNESIDPIAFKVFKLIRLGVIESKELLKKKKLEISDKKTSSPKILCMVYTHSRSHQRVRAIVNTWGSQCDGFFAASNETDLSIRTINLVHNGPEAYNNMWQKVRSMWIYAYENFLYDFDYFHISGDDSYVVVDNMRSYLQGKEIELLLHGYIDNFSKPYFEKTKKWTNMKNGQKRPLLLGIPLVKGKDVFPQGGGGYTLNREALRLIGKKDGPLHTMLADKVDSREDAFIAALLSAEDTYVSDTRDKKGAFRYIPYRPKQRIKGKAKYPKKFRISPVLSGLNLFSKETVALHLRDMDTKSMPMDEVIIRTHDIINGDCDALINLNND
ncbi:hypothetical protein CTEN210_06887 [Chaetoceros tenuissimus]|uniref:N-acetylgalactosaminide beta-1,3-galactosyltransferase n=1 Tax=Chaetoceros tenuissimus TaxID=426638 RepID=A0AAD3CQP8_9STRA|nr:hypothetical protein CTEN210_06887 [Chaetoceros tenuissimus]